MRKHLWILLILLVIVPVNVFAKCDVISGTGYKAGDHVVCGDKDFHVFSFDGHTLRLLSDNYITYGMILEDYLISGEVNNNLRNISINDIRYTKALKTFKEYLYNNGVETKKIDILTMQDINEFVKENGGGYLPKNFNGDLLEYIDIKYDFLWQRKINLKTVVDDKKITKILLLDDGKVQEKALGDKFYFRPVIDVDVREIEFRVDVINYGEGEVDLDQEIYLPGELVTFDARVNEGYLVDEIVAFDSNGELIEMNDNRFIMPDSDVRLRAYYKSEVDDEETIELTTSINDEITNNTKYMIILGVVGFITMGLLGIDYLFIHKQ